MGRFHRLCSACWLVLGVGLLSPGAAAADASGASAGFDYTGHEQRWTTPADMARLAVSKGAQIEVFLGANGGRGGGSVGTNCPTLRCAGGVVQAEFHLSPGIVIFVDVGASGENANAENAACSFGGVTHTCHNSLGGKTPGGYGGGGLGGPAADSGDSGGGGGGTFLTLQTPSGRVPLVVAGGGGGSGGFGYSVAGGEQAGGQGGSVLKPGGDGAGAGLDIGGRGGVPPATNGAQGRQGAPGAAVQCGTISFSCCPSSPTKCYYQGLPADGKATCEQIVPHNYCGGIGITGFFFSGSTNGGAGGGGGGGGGYLGGGGGGGGALYSDCQTAGCHNPVITPGGGGGGAGGASYYDRRATYKRFSLSAFGDGIAEIGAHLIWLTGLGVGSGFIAGGEGAVGIGRASDATAASGHARACSGTARVSYKDAANGKTTFTLLRLRSDGKWAKAQRFKKRDRAGRNSFKLADRLNVKRLKPGTYRLQTVATFAKFRGSTVTADFKIVRC